MPAAQPPRKPLRRRNRKLLRLGSSVLGAALVGGLGWMLAQTSLSVGTFGVRGEPRFGWLCTMLGESLARLSYDLPFITQGVADVPDVCIIYLDETSARALGQQGSVWDRRLHTQLLKRLAQDAPRAVFFDIVFSDKAPEPGVDEEFADAIRDCKNVFLAAAYESNAGIPLPRQTRIISSSVIAPIEVLRRAAAGWGLIEFDPVDADFGVRRISTGREERASATWEMAVKLNPNFSNTPEARQQTRWTNYYGPSDSFPALSYDLALDPNGTPAGFFRNRIVVIGGRSTLSGVGLGKDDFRNPYGLLGGQFSTGVEVHLTTLLNLLRGEWLTRLDPRWEPWLALGYGILLGGLLPRFRPHLATLIAALSFAGVCIFALWLFAAHRVWFAWCVPAIVQTPVALAWAIGTRYFIEERRLIALRNAFGHYLSVHIADRIANSDFDLAPGGAVVEASVLFTDLEGFTPLTEQLHNPELVTQILVKYFTQTTAHILDNEGMILNFVGDALTAVWGAPLTDPDHVRKAALAAWRLHGSAHFKVDGHILRTRIGLHTGLVLAGNIGSAERFDYAVVGDPVNFASRLEGLNKFLGTNVLISEAVRRKLGDEFIARRLGEFRVVGKKEACVIHEFLGPASEGAPAAWCGLFEKGVAAFSEGDLDAAERHMRETVTAHDGADGPAEFYLGHIANLRKKPLPPDWSGIVEFTEK